MRVQIPVLFERESKSDLYHVRPALIPGLAASGRSLKRALDSLATSLREMLRRLPPSEVAACLVFPALSLKTVEVVTRRRKGELRGKFRVLSFPAGELGRAVMLPDFEPGSRGARRFGGSLPEPFEAGLWCLMQRGERLESRVADLLEDFFRQVDTSPDAFKARGWSELTTLAMRLDLSTKLPLKSGDGDDCRVTTGSGRTFEGPAELERTATNLSGLYPERLSRAFLRETELGRVEDLLWRDERRAILVCGPAGVGKTALLHELAWRHEQDPHRKSKGRGKRQLHQLEPRLVVAGMSFVGEWEKRFEAILKELHRRDHVLVLTDLLDLFRAGRSSRSDTSLATMLRPEMQRGRLRVVAEATPEVWRRVREEDRGFAELFKVVRLDPLDEAATLSVMIRAQRPLERDHQVDVRPEALARIVELQRRFVRRRVFPGKAVTFLERLVRRHSGHDHEIEPSHATQLFAEWSGLSLGFLNDEEKFHRQAVTGALSRRVVGQPEAVSALADAVLRARAGLNDPGRPFASLLFVGPTGVGKTEVAKALAEYPYGDASRLLRFDMNECPDAGSVDRLLGSPFGGDSEEDGQLTRAVRHRPFSVVLFDEIEKAHPAIVDLLLQVLDEGRLTDSRGRVADFSNTVVLLTSNLGVARARGASGLPGGRARAAEIYREEVQREFRPEFVNRLDAVLPFHELGAEQLRTITRLVVNRALQREGLRRRRVVLDVGPRVLERIMQEGLDEDLGARPLGRAVQRLVLEPLARRLASAPIGLGAIASFRAAAEGVLVGLQTLRAAPRQARPAGETGGARLEPQAAGAVIEDLARRLRDRVGDGWIRTDNLDAGTQLRYRLRDELDEIKSSKLLRAPLGPPRFVGSTADIRSRGAREVKKPNLAVHRKWPDDELEDFLDPGDTVKPVPAELLRRRRELAVAATLVHALDEFESDSEPEEALFEVRALAPFRGEPAVAGLLDVVAVAALEYGFDVELDSWRGLQSESGSEALSGLAVCGRLRVRGACVRALLETLVGTALVESDEGPVPIALALIDEESAGAEDDAGSDSAVRDGEQSVDFSLRVVDIGGGLRRSGWARSRPFFKSSVASRRWSRPTPSNPEGGWAVANGVMPWVLRLEDLRSSESIELVWPIRDSGPVVEWLGHRLRIPGLDDDLPEVAGDAEASMSDEGEQTDASQ